MAKRNKNSHPEDVNNPNSSTKPDVRSKDTDTVWTDMVNDTLAMVNS